MTQPTETETIWVTQEAFKENGGYHAAREEQGKTEARIRQLEDMLRRAEVGDKPADDGVVEAGMIVTIRFKGDTGTEQFLLGSRELMSMDSSVEIDDYSPTSPLLHGSR